MSRLVAAEQLGAIEFNLTRARKLKLTWEIKICKYKNNNRSQKE